MDKIFKINFLKTNGLGDVNQVSNFQNYIAKPKTLQLSGRILQNNEKFSLIPVHYNNYFFDILKILKFLREEIILKIITLLTN